MGLYRCLMALAVYALYVPNSFLACDFGVDSACVNEALVLIYHRLSLGLQRD